jgi:hypothetical protein
MAICVVSFILILSLSIVSAGWFDKTITGKPIFNFGKQKIGTDALANTENTAGGNEIKTENALTEEQDQEKEQKQTRTSWLGDLFQGNKKKHQVQSETQKENSLQEEENRLTNIMEQVDPNYKEIQKVFESPKDFDQKVVRCMQSCDYLDENGEETSFVASASCISTAQTDKGDIEAKKVACICTKCDENNRATCDCGTVGEKTK